MQAGCDRHMPVSSTAAGSSGSRRIGLWAMAMVAASGLAVLGSSFGVISPAKSAAVPAPHPYQDASRHSQPVTISAIFPF